MIDGKWIRVDQDREKVRNGMAVSLTVSMNYCDEPLFTDEQMRVFYEISEAFLFENRMRERNRRKAEKQKQKRREANE